ncbi:S9 family peptidase [Rhodohalobacter mucosus]|uniref:Peptidase S9 family protein n=1 Tax=Rhodohalobacter mucosus TaxID=2079485 RepID=A0A316TQ17_9BACT|nr:S9 family peptidase [Rhodohalobacter mucosus]PWN05761.1 peptidase S9 family protein [Rhodohalobacter mucosus]
MIRYATPLLILLLFLPAAADAQEQPFSRMDVFDLQWVQDPQVSPDGEHIVYVRRGMDIMKDRRTSSLWIISRVGTQHRKLTTRSESESGAVWSPDGSKIAFISGDDTHDSEIFIHWVDSGVTTRISQLDRSPSGLSWSPDGSKIAFSKHVPEPNPVLVTPPDKPEGAEWAEAPRVTTRLNYEQDGTGYLEPGYSHLFVISVDGGHVRRVTSGDYHHSGRPVWTPDSGSLIFSANRDEDWEYNFRDSDIYSVALESGDITRLTDQFGPSHSPAVSPDGTTIAWLGYEDRVQTYQVTELYLMNSDGTDLRKLETGLDRSLSNIVWGADGEGIYFQYDDLGNTKIGYTDLSGSTEVVAENVGGTAVGRPYGGGSFSVSANGVIAMNQTTPYYPAELAVTRRGSREADKITDLNGELFSNRTLGNVEEVWYTSSVDGIDLHGWIVTPPDYDPGQTYPLLVEIHGGPISNYGDRFSPEVQLYASAGYVVFYPNMRGSTGYGEEFGNLLYHDYPGDDYHDIMDGVDLLIERGIADENRLFVTGGSAGGIMTAWIIGKNNRFRAAAVVKPVMNWISKTLAADNYYAYADYRYPGQPWENFETYWSFSPISLVGNVETPTLVMVGTDDLRTPTFEAKQLYSALKLRRVETAYVEVPGAPHFIANRPSQLITKVDHVLAWFEKYN